VIVLDTNVLSELMRPQPDSQVMAWANGLNPQAIAITAINEAEILHGIARLPAGRRPTGMASW
jgi:predicted nucleic acid-binding protein